MPIYEYQCKNCHHHFDLMQKVNEPPAKQCPQCFENSVVRLISAAGFQLKGSGWYVTDFKNKNQPNKEGSSTPAANDSKVGEPSPKETKPNKPKGEND